MFSQRRRILSQNFLYSRKLVEKLVRQSSIGFKDTILEIGPGKGIITEYLLQNAKNVIAVELDAELYSYLKDKFNKQAYKLHLIHLDFLFYKLPKHSYKVFANIPFSIEGKIIRKLLTAPNPPEDCYLVMRQDLAERLSGFYRESQFSISYKPWFDFHIMHHFRKTDYIPAARMETVLLQFNKRNNMIMPLAKMKHYMIFVGQGFGGGKILKYNLRMFLTHNQFVRLSQQYKFNVHARPTDLTLEQWIGIFSFSCKSKN